jgi:HEAT repeat protein
VDAPPSLAVAWGVHPNRKGNAELSSGGAMSLVARMADPNPEVRDEALIFLSLEKEPTDQEFAALGERLQDDSQRIRERAAETLRFGGLGKWNMDRIPSVIPVEVLLAALADRSSKVRENVLRVLEFYPEDERVSSTARTLLSDPIGLVRVRAAFVLWVHLQDLPLIQPVVEEAIRSGDRDAVVDGCQLLTEFGPAAGDVVPLVWEYLRHPDGMVRLNAASALLKCCRDKQVLAEAATILETDGWDIPDGGLVGYAASKLRRAAEA